MLESDRTEEHMRCADKAHCEVPEPERATASHRLEHCHYRRAYSVSRAVIASIVTRNRAREARFTGNLGP